MLPMAIVLGAAFTSAALGGAEPLARREARDMAPELEGLLLAPLPRLERDVRVKRFARLGPDGRAVGGWRELPLGRGASCFQSSQSVFDTFQFEQGPGGVEDITPVGGTACGLATEATRFVPQALPGLILDRPRHVMPFRIDQSPQSTDAQVIRLGFAIDEDPPVRFVVIQVWDEFDAACAGGIVNGFEDFIVLELDVPAEAAPGFWTFVAADLCPFGEALRLPADGEGALDLMLASEVDLEQGTAVFPGRSAMALWSVHPGGAGSLPSVFNRVVPLDQGLFFACLDYSLYGTCPGPLTAMVALDAGTDPCGGNLLGDANCDGVISVTPSEVDFDDLDAFVLAVADPGAYIAMFPACSALCTCDIDGDGRVTVFDIDAFEALLPDAPPSAGGSP